MKRPRNHAALERLRQALTRLGADSIDRLYGLEPPWEPARAGASLAPEEFVAVRCPYCGERLESRVDLTAPEDCYIEDCEVCCRGIEFEVEREEGGARVSLRVRRLD